MMKRKTSPTVRQAHVKQQQQQPPQTSSSQEGYLRKRDKGYFAAAEYLRNLPQVAQGQDISDSPSSYRLVFSLLALNVVVSSVSQPVLPSLALPATTQPYTFELNKSARSSTIPEMVSVDAPTPIRIGKP